MRSIIGGEKFPLDKTKEKRLSASKVKIFDEPMLSAKSM
jgi:hypothetical protein